MHFFGGDGGLKTNPGYHDHWHPLSGKAKYKINIIKVTTPTKQMQLCCQSLSSNQ
jgi:hypothetical protein